ncbi:hypothetical protein ACWECW_22685 [Rhodococcus ruber]
MPVFAVDSVIAVDLAVSLLETVVASPELLETLFEEARDGCRRLSDGLRARAALLDAQGD